MAWSALGRAERPPALRVAAGPGIRGRREPQENRTTPGRHGTCRRAAVGAEKLKNVLPGRHRDKKLPHTHPHTPCSVPLSLSVSLFSLSLSPPLPLSLSLSLSLSPSLSMSLSLSLSPCLTLSLSICLSLPPSLLRSQANIRPAARFVNFKFLSAVRPHDPGRFGSSRRCPYRPVLVAAPCFFCLRTHSPLLPYHCATLLCLCSQQGGCSK